MLAIILVGTFSTSAPDGISIEHNENNQSTDSNLFSHHRRSRHAHTAEHNHMHFYAGTENGIDFHTW